MQMDKARIDALLPTDGAVYQNSVCAALTMRSPYTAPDTAPDTVSISHITRSNLLKKVHVQQDTTHCMPFIEGFRVQKQPFHLYSTHNFSPLYATVLSTLWALYSFPLGIPGHHTKCRGHER